MKEQAWEAVERSAAFGVELHNQVYANLRQAAAAAISGAGFSDDDVRQAGEEINKVEADEARQREDEKRQLNERKEAAYQEDKELQLLTAATLSFLPRYNYFDNTFDVKDQPTVQALSDTVIWLNAPEIHGEIQYSHVIHEKAPKPEYRKYPFYVLGYRYTDNRVLLARPMPSLFRYPDSNQMYYPENMKGFTCHRVTEGILSREIDVPRIAEYIPERKDRKHLQSFMQQDVHIASPEALAQHYDRKTGFYRFDVNSNLAYVMRSPDMKDAYGFRYLSQALEISYHGDKAYEVKDAFVSYGALDLGLVRLMTHFDKGDDYLGLIQLAKNNYLGNLIYSSVSMLLSKAAQSTAS